MADLLNVDEALARVLEGIMPLSAETVPLADALNRMLAENVIASANHPPFDNSSMDGFAIRAGDIAAAAKMSPIQLRISMDIPAGAAPQKRLEAGEAARIMTGAPMPDGADAVIPVEDTDIQWTPGAEIALPETVHILRSVRSGDYVRPAGEDIRAGEVVVSAGTLIGAAEIGVLASMGHANIAVIRQPRVAILSSGDELATPGQALLPGQIYDSNSYALAALVQSNGGIPLRIPAARDTLDDVRRRFQEALDVKPDLILSSAGVSVGAFDVVRAIIDEMGHVDFWRINLRPGKPLAFGNVGGIPFFGLPGNPVSAMVTFDVFVRPVLMRMSGKAESAPTITATIAEDLRSDGRRSYLRVRLARENGHTIAHMTGTQSSGALTSMMRADGLLIVPEGVTQASAGSEFTIRLLREAY